MTRCDCGAPRLGWLVGAHTPACAVNYTCDRDTLINDPGMCSPGCPVHDSAAKNQNEGPT